MKSKMQEQQKQGWSWHLGETLKGQGDGVVVLADGPRQPLQDFGGMRPPA